jgi:hypothetical protein
VGEKIYQMTNTFLRTTIKTGYLSLGITLALLIAVQPAFVFADDSSSSDPSSSSSSSSSDPSATTPPCVPPSQSGAGTQRPTGADANTYTYDCTTGLWENAYFTWNPATHTGTPINPPTYVYNQTTGMWDLQQWSWDAAQNQYVSTTTSVATPPAGALTSGGPVTAAPALDLASPDNSSGNSGPGSNNDNSNSNNSQDNSNDTTNASIGNQITADATTGNAGVLSNTAGGSALTGNAQDIANVMNLLQSSSSLAGPNATTFVSNINGDVNGDLLIDPSLLQPATSQDGLANNTQINDVNNGEIDNNIALDADSGNATVANNTSAGDATSGSADAVANVVNMINSAVSGGQSFLGVINIFGNLTGNILVPQQLLSSLLASNAPSATLNTADITNANILNQFNNQNNQTINNNIATTANSGNATVADNTTAGNATTGAANTNVTIFNLTGQQVVGANSMLVFVNVLGKWVGLIMNAPAGSTAAELGGGITQDTNSSTDANTTNNDTINNNIDVNSQSGNATVAQNTTAGNATSGDANSGVNLLNITNSQMNLSGWFGVLFINVFGTWIGNFGTYDSSATTPPADSGSTTSSTTTTTTADGGTSNSNVKAFRFVPNGGTNFKLVSTTQPDTGVLGASTHVSNFKKTAAINSQPVHAENLALLPILVSLFIILGLCLNEIRTTRRQNRTRGL